MPDSIISQVLLRSAIGLAIAGCIAFAARRAGSLSTSGAIAAACTGTLSTAAGIGWGALLIAYFVAASLLSRYGRVEKERLTGTVVEKTGARDATQVLANGGTYTALLMLAPLCTDRVAALVRIAALGALAASSADTWATEIGTLLGGTPVSLFSFRRLPPGTSGGISAIGTVAMLAGAAFVALVAMILRLVVPSAPLLVTLSGFAGAAFDTLLGATIQQRRWCCKCAARTERRVHECGTRTIQRGGFSWLDNDAVNFFCTVAGAGVAALLARP